MLFILQRFFENNSDVACLNELLMLDYGEVASQCKIRYVEFVKELSSHMHEVKRQGNKR